MREEKKNRHLSKSDPREKRRGVAWDAKEGDVSGSQRSSSFPSLLSLQSLLFSRPRFSSFVQFFLSLAISLLCCTYIFLFSFDTFHLLLRFSLSLLSFLFFSSSMLSILKSLVMSQHHFVLFLSFSSSSSSL